jgi:hypothetical protein
MMPAENLKKVATKAKTTFSCIPAIALVYEGEVMQGGPNGGGANEYGPFNWNVRG